MIVSVCPVGYDLVQSPRGRMCHKTSSAASTWDAAKTACESEGGNLANFKYPAEYVSEFLCKIRKERRNYVNTAYLDGFVIS